MMKMSPSLPKDPDLNGLPVIEKTLARDPKTQHLVLALVDCSMVTTDTDNGSQTPTVRVRAIEVIPPGTLLPDSMGPAHPMLTELLVDLRDARNGQTAPLFDGTGSRI